MWPFGEKALSNVAMLALGPDDKLVVEIAERLSPSQIDEVRDHLASFAGVDRGRVLVVYNATVKVLRGGEPPPPRVILAPGAGRNY